MSGLHCVGKYITSYHCLQPKGQDNCRAHYDRTHCIKEELAKEATSTVKFGCIYVLAMYAKEIQCTKALKRFLKRRGAADYVVNNVDQAYIRFGNPDDVRCITLSCWVWNEWEWHEVEKIFDPIHTWCVRYALRGLYCGDTSDYEQRRKSGNYTEFTAEHQSNNWSKLEFKFWGDDRFKVVDDLNGDNFRFAK